MSNYAGFAILPRWATEVRPGPAALGRGLSCRLRSLLALHHGPRPPTPPARPHPPPTANPNRQPRPPSPQPHQIYYNCSTLADNLALYNTFYASAYGPSSGPDMMRREAARVAADVLALRKDPHMMHQAGGRGGAAGKLWGSCLVAAAQGAEWRRGTRGTGRGLGSN
jgi:hypothetical protein